MSGETEGPPPMLPGSPNWDPRHQTFFLYGPDGTTPIPVPVDMVNFFTYQSIAISTNYGVQIGACIMMLLVILTMSPRLRFLKWATMLHMISLIVSIVRIVLLADFFMSDWNEFYTFYSDDPAGVSAQDYRISVAANTMGVLQLILVEASLMLQAWTVVKLWARPWKQTVFSFSLLISLLAVGFRFAFTVIRNKAIVEDQGFPKGRWVLKANLVMTTVSIFYFCALFGARLAAHMWQSRSFLPSVKTLTAMDVLVMTNTALMIIPALSAGLQWAHIRDWESGSLTLTSVVVLLPFGTLVAQRVASPQFSYSSNQGATSGFSEGRTRFNAVGSAPTKSSGKSTILSQTSEKDGLVTCIASPSVSKRDPIDIELEQIDNDYMSPGSSTGSHREGGGSIGRGSGWDILVEKDITRAEERV